jgi:methionyl-tRNA synthetase
LLDRQLDRHAILNGFFINNLATAYTDFAKVKKVAARIEKAERVASADRLYCLEIECCEDFPRQIVAGIAEYYSPEELIGKNFCLVANLKPAKIRGILSNGMLLASKSSTGMLIIDPGDVKPGTAVC